MVLYEKIRNDTVLSAIYGNYSFMHMPNEKSIKLRILNLKFLSSLWPEKKYYQQHVCLGITEVLHFFSGSGLGLLQYQTSCLLDMTS